MEIKKYLDNEKCVEKSIKIETLTASKMIDKSLVAYNNNRSDGRDDDYHSGQLRTHSVIILSETIRELLPLNCALILQKKDKHCQQTL